MKWTDVRNDLPERGVPVMVTLYDPIKGISWVPNCLYELGKFDWYASMLEDLDEPYELIDNYFAWTYPNRTEWEDDFSAAVIAWSYVPDPYRL